MEKYLNKITQGNCLELIDELPDDSIDSCIIDPPFGCGMDIENDENIIVAGDLLSSFLIKLKPKLKQNGYLAVFWVMRTLDVCIEHVKNNFTYKHTAVMYVPRGAARPTCNGLLPRTQSIVIGQKYLPSQPPEFHGELADYLYKKMIENGYTRSSLAKVLGCDSRLVMKWTRRSDPSYCFPSKKFYFQLKELLKLDEEYDLMLTREPPNRSQRKDFSYKHDCYIVDNEHKENVHPTQKPLFVMEHLVEILTPTNGITLDGFCGSGSTCVAAKNKGRSFIGFEISPKFVEIANKRLQEC